MTNNAAPAVQRRQARRQARRHAPRHIVDELALQSQGGKEPNRLELLGWSVDNPLRDMARPGCAPHRPQEFEWSSAPSRASELPSSPTFCAPAPAPNIARTAWIPPIRSEVVAARCVIGPKASELFILSLCCLLLFLLFLIIVSFIVSMIVSITVYYCLDGFHWNGGPVPRFERGDWARSGCRPRSRASARAATHGRMAAGDAWVSRGARAGARGGRGGVADGTWCDHGRPSSTTAQPGAPGSAAGGGRGERMGREVRSIDRADPKERMSCPLHRKLGKL